MLTRFILISTLFLSLISAEKFTLEKLCKKGIDSNPKIKSFAYKVSASNSFYDQSIDQYKPHFNIDGQYGKQKYTLESTNTVQDFNGVTHQYQFTLNQPIYRAKFLEAITDAEERITLSKLIEEDEKAKLTTQILQSSFELIRLRETIQILSQKEKILEKAYKNIEKKHKLKLASRVDQYQSLSMLKQSNSDLVIARQTYNHMSFNLKMLTKLDNVEKYIKTLEFNIEAIKQAFKKVNISHLKSQYIQNTRVKLERQTVKIAKVQIDLRASERHPNIDLVVSYGDSGGTLDATVRQDDSRAMLTLNFPLYQGGYVSDRVEEARYLSLSAEESAENVEMSVKISLEKKIQDIRSGIESVDAEMIAVQASKKYFDAATVSYQNGLGSLTDAYLAEADYHDNRLRSIKAQTALFTALAEIYYYSGIADIKHIQTLQKKYFR